jgi:hypothetical protein
MFEVEKRDVIGWWKAGGNQIKAGPVVEYDRGRSLMVVVEFDGGGV